MKDYFRREKISFKYYPLFWVIRLLFVFMIITSGMLQWVVILFGSAFSIGFVYGTEMEYMLPMSQEEIKRKRLIRIRNVWIRYAVLGVIGRIYIYFASKNGWYGLHDMIAVKNPEISAAFFVLLMIYAYELMLDAGISAKTSGMAQLIPSSFVKVIIQTIPHIIFFIYAVMAIKYAAKPDGIESMGPMWLHLTFLLSASGLLLINIFVEKSGRILKDFVPSEY
ncbi:hypothetical protein SAMN04487934_102159 [Eubacterium ruminantium]|nr:hypothetical protein SAMN04487934_102159 [Eubacterium ruminantium]